MKMISQNNLIEVLKANESLINEIKDKVEKIKLASDFTSDYRPVEYIKNYLNEHANVIIFPSKDKNYGGLVTYRNGRFYIHINSGQPKIYENFIWAHEFYHYYFEKDDIKNSKTHTFVDDNLLNSEERKANLFAAEFLVNARFLEISFGQINMKFSADNLEERVLRLIPRLEIPYKAIVIKLVQEKLISVKEALKIIDFSYKENIPKDFDQSFLMPSNVISINDLERLMRSNKVLENVRESDLETYEKQYQKHLQVLRKSRG